MKKKLSPSLLAIFLLLAALFIIPQREIPTDLSATTPSVYEEFLPGETLPQDTQSVQSGVLPTAPESTESVQDETLPTVTEPESTEPLLDIHGSYTTKEDVALFIHLYGRLPDNFMTKSQARALGWEHGELEPFAPGMCIGGDRFGNYEGQLPQGHRYYECDIDTLGGGSRGAKRIVFSSDGLIYYTDDHYETFELLYGEE